MLLAQHTDRLLECGQSLVLEYKRQYLSLFVRICSSRELGGSHECAVILYTHTHFGYVFLCLHSMDCKRTTRKKNRDRGSDDNGTLFSDS